MDKRYIDPKHALIHLIEECSELIKVLCKAQRFGLHDHHPADPPEQSNLVKLIAEKRDVDQAFLNFIDTIETIPEDQRNHAKCFLPVHIIPEGTEKPGDCEGDGWYLCSACAYFKEPEDDGV